MSFSSFSMMGETPGAKGMIFVCQPRVDAGVTPAVSFATVLHVAGSPLHTADATTATTHINHKKDALRL